MTRTRRKRRRKHINLVPIVGIILGVTGEADFTGANLRGAQLLGSNIGLAQIQSAAILEDVIMPDGSPYAIWLKQPVTYEQRKTMPSTMQSNRPQLATINKHKSSSPFAWLIAGVGLVLMGQQIWNQLRE